MTKGSTASLDSSLFAHKGTARPASALRSIYPETGDDEDLSEAGFPDPAPKAKQFEPDDELEAAASLLTKQFKPVGVNGPTRPPADTGQVETLVTAQPSQASDIPAAQSTAAATEPVVSGRTSILRRLMISAGFVVLAIVSLGIGFTVNLIARDSAPAPEASTTNATTQPEISQLATPPDLGLDLRNTIRLASQTEVAAVPKPDLDSAAAAALSDSDKLIATPTPIIDLQYAVQVGSVSDRRRAEELWREITGAHAELFAGKGLDVRPVGAADQTRYWVQTGTFGDITGAQGFCEQVQSRGVECLVVKK